METSKLPFQFFAATDHATLVLTPHLGDVAWGDVELVGAEIIQQMENVRPPPKVLIDLSSLNYMGSSQVALLVRIWKAIKGRNGQLAVQVTHPVVLEVLQIAGLHNLWSIVSNREDALETLGLSRRGSAPASILAGVILGLLGVIAAVVGLSLSFFGRHSIPVPTLEIIRYSAAGVGAVGGLWAALSGRGMHRILGVVLLTAALGLVIFQYIKQPAG